MCHSFLDDYVLASQSTLARVETQITAPGQANAQVTAQVSAAWMVQYDECAPVIRCSRCTLHVAGDLHARVVSACQLYIKLPYSR